LAVTISLIDALGHASMQLLLDRGSLPEMGFCRQTSVRWLGLVVGVGVGVGVGLFFCIAL
jgi:hypothetical protein